jgi:hypothetical protein
MFSASKNAPPEPTNWARYSLLNDSGSRREERRCLRDRPRGRDEQARLAEVRRDPDAVAALARAQAGEKLGPK